jgi:rhamnosyltransferase
MMAHSVCAVIVTYHPSEAMLEIVDKVLAQVQGLVVVDNGSHDNELNSLRAKKQSLSFHLIENGENFGVAEALNRGVRWATNNGYSWVVLFDQDSELTEGFIKEMFAAWETHPDREKVASIHPGYVHPGSGIEAKVPHARDGSPLFPMTSGSLIAAWTFNKVGWFASEYFIDLVDWEYCFRIRSAGYLVVESRYARLLHAVGDPKRTMILGHTFQPSHHDAMRRYYISRNTLVFFRKYLGSFPMWVLSGAYAQLKETIVCLLIEEDRARKLRSVLLGTWDALTGRMGKREGL